MRKPILILLFALLGILSARAYDFYVDGIYYKRFVGSDHVAVTNGSVEYSGSVVIPSTVTYRGKTYAVIAIGDYAFRGCSGLTSVTIPNSVTFIEYEAFSGCSGLTSVTIPNSVTSIGYAAFSGCTSISSPLYNSKVFAYMPQDYSGEYAIPSGIQSIAGGAFRDCTGLTTVTIPESVTSIGVWAFSGCGLTSVEWNAVACQDFEDIDYLPFYNCKNITSIIFGNQVERIPAYLCYALRGLTTVTIPESVTTIGSSAFSDCSRLTSVTIGENVTSIGESAFSGCSGLTSVTIPNSVTTIGDYAFRGCSGLTSVKWNAIACYNASSSSYSPFTNTSLTSIAFGSKVEHIPAYLCYGMNKLTSVTIPESVTSIGEYAFSGCSGLTSVTIPNSVTSIGYAAFADCSGLTSVTIPESVTSIGKAAFEDCSGLTSVTIPESVTSIGEAAFKYCSGLTSVYYTGNLVQWCGIGFGSGWWFSYNNGWDLYINNVKVTDLLIPDGVTSIGDYAFYYCRGLTSVTIPNSVDTIGNYAFYYCRGLTSVTIPESVTSIGSSTFYGCSGLTSVEWNAIACYNASSSSYSPFTNTSLTSIAFGSKVEHIPAYLCYGMNKLTSVTIPESVTSIGKYAFSDCSSLTSVEWNAVACRDFSSDNPPFSDNENITSVTFGKQVEHIPAFLCYGLSGLTAITLPGSVDTVGKAAFKECNYLLSVTSLSKTPPYCFYDEENSVFSVYGTLFVPKGSKKAYQTAQEWYKFSRIEETETTYTVTVQPNNANMGTVTGGGEYQEGEQAILAAIPNQGYRFVRWDDGSTNNPRIMTVNEDITLTAIFAKKTPDNPDDPDNPDNPTANENVEADNFRVYVQDRTIHLSEDRGLVQVYNMAGQCIYNGHATAIPVSQPGVYILRLTDGRSRKIIVR